MNLKIKQPLKNTDLFSLAKNITKSKSIIKTLMTNTSIQKENNQNISHSQNKKTPPLLYSYVLQSKERNRAVSERMNSFLKINLSNTPNSRNQKVIQNPKQTEFITSQGTNISEENTNQLDISYRNHQKNINNYSSDRHSYYTENNSQNEQIDSNNNNENIKKYISNYLLKRPLTEIDIPNSINNSPKPYNDNILSSKNFSDDINISVNQNNFQFIPKSNKSLKVNYFRNQTPNNNILSESMHNNNISYCYGYGNNSNNKNEAFFRKVNNNTQEKTNIITSIKLEDLIVLEEKLYNILTGFKNGKPIAKQCIEWWSFYIYSSFCGKFEFLFTESSELKQLAHEASSIELLSIILTYEVLRELKKPPKIFNSIKNMINEVHQNFLIIVDLILTRINSMSMSNIWINKIQNIISSKRTYRIYQNDHMKLIKKNIDFIENIIKNILNSYSSNSNIDTNSINYFLNQISKISIKILNDFFRKKLNDDDRGVNLMFGYEETSLMPKIPVPYLSLSKNKNFTLVIDLDQTLISVRKDEEGKKLFQMRPGLITFLTELKPLYELVLFTFGTQNYADPLVDLIEKKQKFFDQRLYRQHAAIIDNVFVKDLSKLGRELSKTIIIDNIPHNFIMQKENGIFIKNFNGDDNKDTVLIDLIPILISIASDENNDVRKELKRFEREIFTKITTNLKN